MGFAIDDNRDEGHLEFLFPWVDVWARGFPDLDADPSIPGYRAISKATSPPLTQGSTTPASLRSGADAGRTGRKYVHGTPALGAELYATQCAQCHGTWETEAFAPRLTSRFFLDSVADTYLQATMALGRHGSAMRSMMRNGGGVVEMSSKDVNDIIAYLRKSAEQQSER